MTSRIKVAGAVVVGVALGIAAHLVLLRKATVFESSFDNVMGTSLEFRVQASRTDAARQAEASALAEIARLSKILSGYDRDSEFSRWAKTQGTPTPVSPELVAVLAAFDEWRTRTGGALDASAEAAGALWRAAEKAGRLPTVVETQAAAARIRQRHWQLDPSTSTAIRTSDVPVLLNSFTKSFIVDRAAKRALDVPGVTGVLINAGGDVVVRGNWSQVVGVADPVANADNAPALERLAVRDAVIATSGGAKRGFDIGGHHFSHVIDPRTALPAGHVASATVVAADAIQAGALATAFCVLTPAESAALARSLPGVEFTLVLADGHQVASPGWQDLAVNTPSRRIALPAVETVYAAEQAPAASPRLTISLELARMAGMSRRPYVAVWIEDKDKFPVRTVALWYDSKARYLPELRAWYRADRLRAMAEGSQIVDAVTSATRTAGKYTLQWDGKDNAGKPVRPGTYTVIIEASREHGTYQLIRQDLDLAGGPKHIDLQGGTEISAAALDYQQAGR